MHLGMFKVCIFVVTAIVNHPLLFPKDGEMLPVTDEALTKRLQEYEEYLNIQQQQLEASTTCEGTLQEPFKLAIAALLLLVLLIQILMFELINKHSEEEDDGLQAEGNMEDLLNNYTMAAFNDFDDPMVNYEAAGTENVAEVFAEDEHDGRVPEHAAEL